MLRLNHEVLFDIGKQLIEDGDAENVYKFAVSGKEPYKAMAKVFASLTNVELYTTYYTVGWKDKCCEFELGREKPHSKFLFNQIGNSVTTLHIHSFVPLYQSILDKIVTKKHLDTLYVSDTACNNSVLYKFISRCPSTLKNVSIPNLKMTKTFRDSLNLQTLTISNFREPHFPRFCCKTASLEFSNRNEFSFLVANFWHAVDIKHTISPHISTIKELTFNETTFYWRILHEGNQIDYILYLMKHFSSLETLKFNYTWCGREKDYFDPLIYVKRRIRHLNDIIDTASQSQLPSKITCSFYKSTKNLVFPNLEVLKKIFRHFEYDETPSDFHCFQRTLQSVGNKESIFEVKISK
uniref:DUF38 domain-containing protein n=1 Tax=Panagrolaimus sp. ES5 TaxID=591445 RepID=A0AC34FLQ0_9BILA